MAERVPSPSPPPPPADFFFSSGTYVVQVPKDQIYRIPPPENALIVERHRNPSSTSNRRPCSSCCFRFMLPLVVVILLVVLLVILIPHLRKPKAPIFKISKFSAPSSRQFNIKLKLKNPNGSGAISFKQGGRASVSFKDQDVATGKFPAVRQPHDSSQDVALALPTAKSLPKEIQKSFKNNKTKRHVSLTLYMKLSAETKAAQTATRNDKFVVVCTFTVDSLAKASRILSQECDTQRQ
ncbi:NDR1/HIN1-like protein 13 [Momordica charantia]|uniref:NDR1/HIN1-like protein 13 n=1 Tax=Momordica charantia TaxID=3673 RepID=A0A6J1BS66_MOMCH|nr:NDR1/HIN1-like protein 13 [Momordica charantia]